LVTCLVIFNCLMVEKCFLMSEPITKAIGSHNLF